MLTKLQSTLCRMHGLVAHSPSRTFLQFIISDSSTDRETCRPVCRAGGERHQGVAGRSGRAAQNNEYSIDGSHSICEVRRSFPIPCHLPMDSGESGPCTDLPLFLVAAPCKANEMYRRVSRNPDQHWGSQTHLPFLRIWQEFHHPTNLAIFCCAMRTGPFYPPWLCGIGTQ